MLSMTTLNPVHFCFIFCSGELTATGSGSDSEIGACRSGMEQGETSWLPGEDHVCCRGVEAPVISTTETKLSTEMCFGVIGENTGASGDADVGMSMLENDSKCPKLMLKELIFSL